MKLQEAREFVAHFNAGSLDPEENAEFLQWLTEATIDELTIIADTHESMFGNWAPGTGPSTEWIMQLERKLDRSRGENYAKAEVSRGEAAGLQVVEMPEASTGRRRIGWWVAAVVAIVVAGGNYLFVSPSRTTRSAPVSKAGSLSITVSNPPGNDQRAFVLPDGSKVFLNAGSTLTYPPRFAGSERQVELTGDAFFDVKPGANTVFRVKIRYGEVEVLGTYFEIAAYGDEQASLTTVIEGAIKVTSGGQTEILRPGDQAEISYPSPGVGAALRIRSGIDIKTAIDWRNGIYDVNGADLKTVLHVLARRYGLTVEYEPNIPDPSINGNFDLHKSMDILLQGLSASLPDNIHINANKRTLTVTAN
ncbi:MAG TPA: FecR domain-containing protein [Puia sp.]|nr:FecR domain-containing protein [Puia sp.]